MDAVVKPTHFPSKKMRKRLEVIGAKGMRRAVREWEAGKRPDNINKFRRANGWVVGDYAIRHRPLISLASQLCGLKVMNPNNFGLPNDGICKIWFKLSGYSIQPAGEIQA